MANVLKRFVRYTFINNKYKVFKVTFKKKPTNNPLKKFNVTSQQHSFLGLKRTHEQLFQGDFFQATFSADLDQ